MASFVRLSHLSGRSSNVGNVHSNASDTVPTMEIGDETVADAKHLINSKINHFSVLLYKWFSIVLPG